MSYSGRRRQTPRAPPQDRAPGHAPPSSLGNSSDSSSLMSGNAHGTESSPGDTSRNSGSGNLTTHPAPPSSTRAHRYFTRSSTAILQGNAPSWEWAANPGRRGRRPTQPVSPPNISTSEQVEESGPPNPRKRKQDDEESGDTPPTGQDNPHKRNQADEQSAPTDTSNGTQIDSAATPSLPGIQGNEQPAVTAPGDTPSGAAPAGETISQPVRRVGRMRTGGWDQQAADRAKAARRQATRELLWLARTPPSTPPHLRPSSPEREGPDLTPPSSPPQ